LGHKSGVKGMILYDLHNKEIFISRNVSHHDHILPYESNSPHSNWHYHIEFEPNINLDNQSEPTFTHLNNDQTNTKPHIPDSTNSNQNNTNSLGPTNSPNIIDLTNDSSTQNNSQTDITLQQNDNASNITSDQHNNTSPSIIPSTRPTRAKHAPSYLRDYVCNTSSSFPTSSSKGTLYPICDYHTFSYLSPTYHAYTLSITHNTEPTSYLEACILNHNFYT
jgi:hypothetical protein